VDVIGYSDKLSLRAGERVQFFVSSVKPSYHVDIVRLDHSLAFPKEQQMAETIVPAPVSGEHPGREQPINIGSAGIAAHSASLEPTDGVAFAAWLLPTLPARGREQGIAAKWSPEREIGFALLLDADGRLVFRVGDGETAEIATDAPVTAGRWLHVAATHDAKSGETRLLWRERDRGWLSGGGGRKTGAGKRAANEAVFTLGALSRDDKGWISGHFNGKVDRPGLWGRALTDAEIERLANDDDPTSIPGGIAIWDPSKEMRARVLRDETGNGNDLTLKQLPARAVTGANWTGDHTSYLEDRTGYGAIAFHEDDLEDCEWEADFAFDVPADLPSGLYAARLSTGGEPEHIPFYVRPAAGAKQASILYLAPTNTYLAYGNERLYHGTGVDETMLPRMTSHKIELTAREDFMDAHPELGSSAYDRHPDEGGIMYSSRLRPILTMRPEFTNFMNAAPRHFAGDLWLLEWLERSGFVYDVATDEDVHMEGLDAFKGYKVIVTGSHPEYWTTPMMDALEAYLSGGGRMMYLGGNGFYWVTAIDSDHPHVIELRRGYNGIRAWESEPGEGYFTSAPEEGGLWRYRGRTPNKLTGVGFTAQGWGGAEGYSRLPDSFDPRAQFIFEGIGDDEVIGDFGLVMGGAAGDELDRYDLQLGTPPETLRLATSEGRHSDYYQLVIEDIRMTLPGYGGTQEPKVRADLTYLEGPNGGAVFSVGSIAWTASLPWNNFDNNVSTLTGNVLRKFSEK
jgi:N,N-dimethylformamidase